MYDKHIQFGCTMEDKLCVLGNDLVTDILSRLPLEAVFTFKCTRKRWYDFVSDSTFQRIYSMRMVDVGYPDPLGVYVQTTFRCCDLHRDNITNVALDTRTVSTTVLDFLPVRTALVACSNGMLLCRNLNTSSCHKHLNIYKYHERIFQKLPVKVPVFEPPVPLVLYICNPCVRDWIAVTPPHGINLGKAFAFALDPNNLRFTIVGVQPSESNHDRCSFLIYDSTLKKWRTTREFDCFVSDMCIEKHAMVNGRCHWAIERSNGLGAWGRGKWDYHLLIFDVTEEWCRVIDLPPDSPRNESRRRPFCLGVSDGLVHYFCCYTYEVKIWVLKDDEWVPSTLRFPPITDFVPQHWELIDMEHFMTLTGPVYSSYDRPEDALNSFMKPINYYDGVLFISIRTLLAGYNLKCREHVPLSIEGVSTIYESVFLLNRPSIFHFKTLASLESSAITGCTHSFRLKKAKRS